MGKNPYLSLQTSVSLPRQLFARICATVLLSLPLIVRGGLCHAQTSPPIQNRTGVRMTMDTVDHDPAIRLQIPGTPEVDCTFTILFPEHVTVRALGSAEATHLYIYRPGQTTNAPQWKTGPDSLSYEADLGNVRLGARATLEGDGIRFRYDFQNKSDIAYDMASAVTDPRFRILFYDPRLERTYVHQRDGFTLLASETPGRLQLPLSRWLPAHYHAQYTAPIPAEKVQHRADGITYYYRRESVDVPLIATLSVDRRWVAATFASDPGNVWSNPELTCQHADPQVSLPPHGHAYYEL